MGLGGLESGVLKGEWGKSPWAHSEAEHIDENTKDNEQSHTARGIPRDMQEWEEWETERKEKKEKAGTEVERISGKARLSKAHKRSRTTGTDCESPMPRTSGETPRSSSISSAANPKIKNRTINNIFGASKSSASIPVAKASPSVSTPRSTSLAKSASFPSLDTINSAARSPSPRSKADNRKYGLNGLDEEILSERGCTQMILPSSRQAPLSSFPLSSAHPFEDPQQFLSSPILPQPGANAAFTSTPHRNANLSLIDPFDTGTTNVGDPGNAITDGSDEDGACASAVRVKPNAHRLTALAMIGSGPSSQGDNDIEAFLVREQDSVE
ncbi:uncharacterized protein JCM15063_002300 [Sporobolomyces koalae]|uniref:uncharacterized protein n=1 Tax=Sporobolomyces koalae TaxID=500713 RepID=UPI003171D562